MSSKGCSFCLTTYQGSCGGCDFTYTAKNPKQASMYKRLHEKKCKGDNPHQHRALLPSSNIETLKINKSRIVDTSTVYTTGWGK